MAIQALVSEFPLPRLITCTPTLTGQTFGSTRPKVANIFRVPKSGTLDSIEVFFNVVTTAHDIKVSFQGVTTGTGLIPDGVIGQFRVIPAASVTASTWVSSGLITSDGTDGGTKRTVTAGDLVAVVFEWDSTVGSVTLNIASSFSNEFNLGGGNLLFVKAFTTSWTGGSPGGSNLALKYSDGTYPSLGPAHYPVESWTAESFSNASSPNYRGMFFSLPFKCRVSGVWLALGVANSSATFDLVIYASGVTAVASLSLTFADFNFSSTGALTGLCMARFASAVDLDPGDYRFVLKPTSTNAVFRAYGTFASAAIVAGFQQGWYETSATNPTVEGDWTDTQTRVPQMGLLITGLDDGASSGGSGEVSAVFCGAF